MSTQENSTSEAPYSGSGTHLYLTMDQAAIAAAHRSMKKSFDFFPPLGDKTSINSLD